MNLESDAKVAVQPISICRLFPDYGNDVHTGAISGDVFPSLQDLADSDALEIAVH